MRHGRTRSLLPVGGPPCPAPSTVSFKPRSGSVVKNPPVMQEAWVIVHGIVKKSDTKQLNSDNKESTAQAGRN